MTLVAVKHSIAELVMKSGVCLSVCGHSDVRLTSPPVLKLCDTEGYLWLPYLTEVIKLIYNNNIKLLEIKPCGFESRIRDVCS